MHLDGFGHRAGESSLVNMIWIDARRELRLAERLGQYPGMPTMREIRVVLVRPGHGIGETPCATPDATAIYDGQALTLSFPSMDRPTP